MIKILILTEDIWKWYYFILNMMEIDTTIQRFNHIEIRNKMFTFHIRTSFPESLRGAAFAHVIEDKRIDDEDFYRILLPTIKQRVTQYGSRTILGER
jgi:hypothetical protein